MSSRDEGEDGAGAGRSTARSQLRLVDPTAVVTAPEPSDLNLRIVQPLFWYMREHFGDSTVEKIAAEGGVALELLDHSAAWISHGQFERMLAAARALLPSDQEFMRACVHDIVRMYGPLVLVLRCMSVRSTYAMMAKTIHLASRISKYDVLHDTRTSIRLRYSSTRDESRLMCLSRQAQLRTLPTVYWGMAPARIEESSCIARGDGCCEYQFRWYEPVRWRGPLFGALTGALGSLLLLWTESSLMLDVALGSLPIFGLFAGLLLEQRRLVTDHMVFAEETNRELEHLVQAHARAVDEVQKLHQRERFWSQQLEHQIAQRTARLDSVVERFRASGAPRRDKLRGLSHDINNPLTVLLGLANQLHRRDADDPETKEIVETLETAVNQMSQLVRELAGIVREDPTTQEFETESIDIEELAARMRRQLRATVVGRDIRITVFQTREAPRAIRAVPMMLERIIDNILTNAAKYTERGSIVVEVGGTPGFLLVKVSDTGRGIGPERLEQVLRTGGPDPNPPVGGSRGAGLSIVARLLDQLGGRLEIMSEPGEGTTVWMYMPCEGEPSERSDSSDQRSDAIEHVLRRVVKIRAKTKHGIDDHGFD